MTVRSIRRVSKAEAFSQFRGRPTLVAKMVRQLALDAAIDPDAVPASKVASNKSPFRTANRGRGCAMMSLDAIDRLTGRQLGVFDVPCPQSGIEAKLRGGRR
jgi:hypothetical protein